MTGWLHVANAGGLEDHELARWITVGSGGLGTYRRSSRRPLTWRPAEV